MKLKMTKKKLLAAILSTALVCGVGVGGTVAWLHDSAGVTNEFSLANVEGSIDEEFDKTVKESITIKNDKSDIPVYVRVTLSACWMDGDDVAPLKAELDFVESDNWFEVGGIYYYKKQVPAGESATWNLNAQPTDENAALAEKDWKFRVDVSAQMIQAEPDEAVESAWTDVQVNGNNELERK